MVKSRPILSLVLIWLAWAVVLSGFQALATKRFSPQGVDYALTWTPGETGRNGQRYKPYLLDPFLNEHVSWDSEFYLSIATKGYDDPDLRALRRDGPAHAAFIPATGLPYGSGGAAAAPKGAGAAGDGRYVSLNYAFFPLYPYAMHAAGLLLRPFGLNPIATATLAGVLVSLLGALAAMFALYDLTKDRLGEDGALRAAFYLLIFPTGFFLAQVYTEGLFVGLAFGSLALARRRRLLLAGVLAVLATWTRAAGVALVFPLALAWLAEWRAAHATVRGLLPGKRASGQEPSSPPALKGLAERTKPDSSGCDGPPPSARGASFSQPGASAPGLTTSAAHDGEQLTHPARGASSFFSGLAGGLRQPSPRFIGVVAAALPLLAFAAWRVSPLGANFQFVEDRFFGRGVFVIDRLLDSLGAGVAALSGTEPQAAAYYAIEFAIILLALAACLATLRREPDIALFGLAVLAISLGSGAVQSMNRYVLAIPSIYIALAQLGRWRAFDRSWTLASALLLGLLATLFSLDMWVG